MIIVFNIYLKWNHNIKTIEINVTMILLILAVNRHGAQD